MLPKEPYQKKEGTPTEDKNNYSDARRETLPTLIAASVADACKDTTHQDFGQIQLATSDNGSAPQPVEIQGQGVHVEKFDSTEQDRKGDACEADFGSSWPMRSAQPTQVGTTPGTVNASGLGNATGEYDATFTRAFGDETGPTFHFTNQEIEPLTAKDQVSARINPTATGTSAPPQTYGRVFGGLLGIEGSQYRIGEGFDQIQLATSDNRYALQPDAETAERGTADSGVPVDTGVPADSGVNPDATPTDTGSKTDSGNDLDS